MTVEYVPLARKQIVLLTEDGARFGPYEVIGLEYRQIGDDVKEVTVVTRDIPA